MSILRSVKDRFSHEPAQLADDTWQFPPKQPNTRQQSPGERIYKSLVLAAMVGAIVLYSAKVPPPAPAVLPTTEQTPGR